MGVNHHFLIPDNVLIDFVVLFDIFLKKGIKGQIDGEKLFISAKFLKMCFQLMVNILF
jgi:hypothetical protein